MADGYRALPASIEAEQAVLGGLMLAPESWANVSDLLAAEDFSRRDHGMIWSAIKALAEKDKPFDAVTLAEWFAAQGMTEMVAGGSYVIELAATTPSAANIRAYAEIVKDKAMLRRLIDIGSRAQAMGFDPAGRDTSELLAEVTREVTVLSGARSSLTQRSMREIGRAWLDNLQAMYEAPGTAHGLLSPWGSLNAITNGFYDGDLVIGAGRPGMGKSAFGVNLSLSAALRGEKAMIFSLEMTDTSLFNRMAASLTDIPLAWLRRPDAGKEEEAYWPRITDAIRRMRDAPIVIDQSPGLSVDAIVARAKREHMRSPLRLVVVDHMHLIQLPKRENGATEYGDVSHALKNLAKTLNCPVVPLAQLNRSVESRTNKRPVMSDLRESGAIEQDADTIIFFYRDDYYANQEGRTSASPGVLEMIVAKQREGATGTAYTRSELEYGRIGELPDGYVAPVAAPKTKRGFNNMAEG